MIIPATAAAMPPAICCKDALILINAPLSWRSGIAVVSAVDGMMRLNIPAIIITLKIMTNQSGSTESLVYATTTIITKIEAQKKIVYLSYLSLSLPTSGMMI